MKRPVDATGDQDTLILGAGAVLVTLVAVGGAWVSLHVAARLTGRPAPLHDPLRLMVSVVSGRTPWPTAASYVAGALVLVLLLLVFAVIILWPRKQKKMRPDRSTRYLGKGRDIAHLTTAGSQKTAVRLGTTGTGFPLGVAVGSKVQLHTSLEDMAILIAGPRTQKTTAYAIPAVLAAPGAALATSNKRDLLDATAAIRAQRGHVWVLDPQGVADTPASWYWDPLSYVGYGREASDTRADRLAAQFVTATRPAGAKVDAYFDTQSENLISLLLLAAACAREPMTTVYAWLTSPKDEAPEEALRDHDYPLHYRALYKLARLPEKQREGVYDTSLSLMGWLRNRDVRPWIVSGAGPAFDPDAFARSTDTLYPLSRVGTGSVGPLVAALTMAVLDALEEAATAAGGRLPVPFLGVLDEAANICRIQNLDGYYSHFGSRGICLLTILQSWAQGAEAWGDKGMEKLWSSANARVYGGGVDDPAFLRRLSDLIGQAEHVVRSSSVSQGRRTITRNVHSDVILSPAELRELPMGRAVLFASGTPAVLTHPVPWWEGQHAATITAALAKATA